MLGLVSNDHGFIYGTVSAQFNSPQTSKNWQSVAAKSLHPLSSVRLKNLYYPSMLMDINVR